MTSGLCLRFTISMRLGGRAKVHRRSITIPEGPWPECPPRTHAKLPCGVPNSTPQKATWNMLWQFMHSVECPCPSLQYISLLVCTKSVAPCTAVSQETHQAPWPRRAFQPHQLPEAAAKSLLIRQLHIPPVGRNVWKCLSVPAPACGRRNNFMALQRCTSRVV